MGMEMHLGRVWSILQLVGQDDRAATAYARRQVFYQGR